MLSNTSIYAIRATIYLALFASSEAKIGIRQISEELKIPTPFLGKILQVLAKEGILDSTKGPHGGFCLKKSPMDISVMDIVVIIDGTDGYNQCVIRTTACSDEEPCSLHHKISGHRNAIKNVMSSESIADLVSEFRQGREKISL